MISQKSILLCVLSRQNDPDKPIVTFEKGRFDIMQKVGMSDREIRGTVRRQILMVFGLPLAGAVMHTAAGMVMVKGLMGVFCASSPAKTIPINR